jgi:hypothetical protein
MRPLPNGLEINGRNGRTEIRRLYLMFRDQAAAQARRYAKARLQFEKAGRWIDFAQSLRATGETLRNTDFHYSAVIKMRRRA